MPDAADVPTFAEKGYPFYWEQMRAVVGPANMAPEAVTWWQDTLKKVVATEKWQKDYIKRNLLTPTDWTGEQALKYLDGLHTKYDEAIKQLDSAIVIAGRSNFTLPVDSWLYTAMTRDQFELAAGPPLHARIQSCSWPSTPPLTRRSVFAGRL